MNGCAIDPAGGSVSAPANFTLGHKRALPDTFDMKPGFKYYRSRKPVIHNSAREAL